MNASHVATLGLVQLVIKEGSHLGMRTHLENCPFFHVTPSLRTVTFLELTVISELHAHEFQPNDTYISRFMNLYVPHTLT